MAYNYFSGEPVTGLDEGRPLFMRLPDSRLNLANFMRTHIYSSLSALKCGLDILFQNEHVLVDQIYGHGGLFKTPGVGQRLLAAAIKAPVTVMETAGEGGAWGIALLASYMLHKQPGECLAAYLTGHVFKDNPGSTLLPEAEDVQGFNTFVEKYKAALPAEQVAVDCFK